MTTDNVLFLPALTISESAVGTNGAAPADTNVKVVAGWDGVNLHTLLTDNTGKLLVGAGIPPLGQAAMAASLPVAIASDQSAIPASQSGTWNINNVSGTVSLPTGASTAANQATEIGHLVSIDTAVNGTLLVDGSAHTQPVSAVSLPLPTGASTAANQATANASLASIDSKLTAPLVVDGSGVTQPVSAAALPLPAGASTSANQATANASLASIDGKLTSPLTVSVNNFPATQPISAVALPLPTGAATEATLSAANTKLVQLALGSQVQAASLAVTIASNQPAIATTPGVVNTSYTAVGQVAFGSVTNAYTSVLVLAAAARIIYVFNSLDQSVNLSLDGGATDAFVLESGDSFSMDLATNGLNLPTSTDIQVKYTGSAPTSGKIRVTAIG